EITMTRVKKETPLKYCQYCKKKLERKRLPNGDLEYLIHFKKRKFCDKMCMRKYWVLNKTQKNSNERNSRSNAKLRVELLTNKKSCEVCQSIKNLDVHHKDENPYNNSLENLQLLCRGCHIRTHRARTCSICDKPHKGLGYCNKHYIRFKKYGDPLKTKNRVSE